MWARSVCFSGDRLFLIYVEGRPKDNNEMTYSVLDEIFIKVCIHYGTFVASWLQSYFEASLTTKKMITHYSAE